jgi:hypothetical protein
VVEEIAARTNRPVLIGAFHFGALDRGLPAAGRPAVVSQRERGIAYRRYVERAAVAPGLVGVHYALLNDQPVLGRFDGESQQIGFVDVCHRPYRGLVDSASRANESVYLVREGAKEPFAGRAREIPQAGGEAPPTP